MAEFEAAYQATNQRERIALSNVATDRGGMTYGGIARDRMPGGTWEGWPAIDAILQRGGGSFSPTEHERQMLLQLHRTFFLTQFWALVGGDKIADQEAANKVYDVAVHCSRLRAVTWLQTALNVCNRRQKLWADVRVDGQVGPQTLGAIVAAAKSPVRKWLVFQVLETQQEEHYLDLALRDESQEENLLGWYRWRIDHRVPPPPGA